MNPFLGYFYSYGFILAVFFLSFVFQKMKLVREEGARKLIHILVCFTWIIMEKSFSGSIHTVIIPLTFIAVNYLSMKKHLIPGMDRSGDDSYGTVYYAVGLTVMNLTALIWPVFTIPAGIALFALSFGDGFAALFGKIQNAQNRKLKEGKTLFGTAACFLFSILGIAILNGIMGFDIPAWMILVFALITTVLEYVSGKLDNLLIPLGVFLSSSVFLLLR